MANLYNGTGSIIEISSGGITPENSKEFGVYVNNPNPSSKAVNGLRNTNKYPLTACWGNEYLNGWYKKLFYGQAVTIAVDGDSTTEEPYGFMHPAQRAEIIDKIMRIGGHTNFTVIKNGYGSRATGDYTGAYYSSELLATNQGSEPTRESHPNGLLEDTIKQNPDLIIFGYGLNDFNRYRGGQNGALWDSSETLDLQGRLDLFKANIEEFLQRLRGDIGTTVNDRECYGKSEYDTAVILCVPISRAEGESKDWSYYCRGMIQELCREYHCGFFDPTFVNYDHSWNTEWSRNPTIISNGASVSPDGLHPAPQTNADFVSAIQPLLYPMGLWYTQDEKLYSVTYNLENCTLTYQPDHLRQGVKLETVISANEGYTIGEVVITVGGKTSGDYNEASGQIQIVGVSGDIIITATAQDDEI